MQLGSSRVPRKNDIRMKVKYIPPEFAKFYCLILLGFYKSPSQRKDSMNWLKKSRKVQLSPSTTQLARPLTLSFMFIDENLTHERAYAACDLSSVPTHNDRALGALITFVTETCRRVDYGDPLERDGRLC